MLLEIASTGVYRPLWSLEILAELDRTLRLLLAKRGTSPEETDAYLTRLFRQMRIAFPDALVTGWQELVPTIHLPDPNDRHVVAAAWVGGAEVTNLVLPGKRPHQVRIGGRLIVPPQRTATLYRHVWNYRRLRL